MKTIEEALVKLEECGCRRAIPQSLVDESIMLDVERSLGVRLPPSYKKFLITARDYGLNFEEFLWPGSDRDLITTNREEHAAELPDFLVSFLSDGYGTQVCFDTRSPDRNGEYPIVEWEREMLKNEVQEQDLEQIASSFPQWLVDTLEFEIEEKYHMEKDE